jgi:hypothetical protein
MRENDGGVNLIKIHYKNKYKCHIETPHVQLIYANKNVKEMIKIKGLGTWLKW